MIISIAASKGGTGKSTTAAALGSILSQGGHRVILVDMDSQRDLTVMMGAAPKEKNIFECVFRSGKMKAVKINPNLVLIGGSRKMKHVTFMEAWKANPEYKDHPPELVLHRFLSPRAGQADYILLDCPPSLELITENALAVSDYVLIPSQAHVVSVNGIRSTLDFVDDFSKRVNKKLKVLGCFLTRFHKTTNLERSVFDLLKKTEPEKMLKTVIHQNVAVAEATHMGREMERYGEDREKEALVKTNRVFRGLEDYRRLADEILTIINKNQL